MLFAISGSQGSGKSTVLQSLQDKGFPVVQRKTSRSILDEWGVTLSQVNNDRELTVKFQDEILARKQADEKEAVEDLSRIWFTERTYADLFTYALIAIGKDNEYSDWMNDYFDRCKMLQESYKHNFYLRGGMFTVEADGVRGANPHYANMVDVVMKNVLDRMQSSAVVDPLTFQPKEFGCVTTQVIQKENDDRVNFILTTISPFLE